MFVGRHKLLEVVKFYCLLDNIGIFDGINKSQEYFSNENCPLFYNMICTVLKFIKNPDAHIWKQKYENAIYIVIYSAISRFSLSFVVLASSLTATAEIFFIFRVFTLPPAISSQAGIHILSDSSAENGTTLQMANVSPIRFFH